MFPTGRRQRGAGTLPVLLLLLLGLLIFLLQGHQALLGQTRQVASQVRTAMAHEAAEAGLSWAVAALNLPGQPADGARERLVDGSDPAQFRPRSDTVAIACTQDDAAATGWRCAWAGPRTDGTALAPQPPRPADGGRQHPAWLLQLSTSPLATTTPGQLPLLSLAVTGCSDALASCPMTATDGGPDMASATPAEAVRHLHLTLALLGDIAHVPEAALSSGADVRLGAGSRVIRPLGDGGGPAVEAAGGIWLASGSSIQGAPGTPAADAVDADQPALRSVGDRWWRHFGASAALMRQLPSLRHLRCTSGPCRNGDLAAAMADGARALWVDGDLALDGGTWGATDRPLLLLVDGSARFSGALQAAGWLLADRLDWIGDHGPSTSPRGRWQGAITTWGDAGLDGGVDLLHDAQLLARLRGQVGSWTALPASWRDHGH